MLGCAAFVLNLIYVHTHTDTLVFALSLSLSVSHALYFMTSYESVKKFRRRFEERNFTRCLQRRDAAAQLTPYPIQQKGILTLSRCIEKAKEGVTYT